MLRRNKYKKDKYGHILGEASNKEAGIQTSNAFVALKEVEKEGHNNTIKKKIQESTKDWVTKSFGNTGKDAEAGNQSRSKGDKEQHQVNYVDNNNKQGESQV